MQRPLSLIETRVLGCLAEKELSTPEYYPLSLNSLVNACNQKSNRNPVMQLEELDVAEVLENLRPLGLVMQSSDGGRVPKYSHNLTGKLSLVPAELAIITELLVRGAQTPGELRQRASRMHPFATLEELEQVIEDLLDREPPILTRLPRQPGRKEQRTMHLLSGKPELVSVETAEEPAVLKVRARQVEMDNLEQTVDALRQELTALRTEFDQFRKQFD